MITTDEEIVELIKAMKEYMEWEKEQDLQDKSKAAETSKRLVTIL